MKGTAHHMKVLAFDFGASSGRAILGIYEGGAVRTEEIHRFSNDPVMVGETFYWDILRLFHEIKTGITKCVGLGHKDIESIGIDTWGVDFGLLDKDGRLLENPVHYRDRRTDGMMEKVFEEVGKRDLYDKTGIQPMDINTINQLCSLKYNRPELLNRAETLLFIPDLLSYFLTGEKNVEYTIASTSQFLNASGRGYDYDIIDKLGFRRSLFPEIVKPGTVRGKLTKELSEELGIGAVDVIAVPSHDTAAAISAAPIEKNEKSLYISSGTWSLLGAELNEPVINDKSYKYQITNEGGTDGSICFLYNISGLWLIQETRRQWIREGCELSFKDLDKMLETEKSAEVYIDPEYSGFVQSGDMPDRISEFLAKTGQDIPMTKGQMILCILESLALTYRYCVETMEDILGYRVDTIHIIGGGTKDKNLCSFTSSATGKKVTAGPVEATAIGNINSQLIAKGKISDIWQARAMSEDYEVYLPENPEIWEKKYSDFIKVKAKAKL